MSSNNPGFLLKKYPLEFKEDFVKSKLAKSSGKSQKLTWARLKGRGVCWGQLQKEKKSIHDLEKSWPIYNLSKTISYLAYIQYVEVEDQSFQVNRLGEMSEDSSSNSLIIIGNPATVKIFELVQDIHHCAISSAFSTKVFSNLHNSCCLQNTYLTLATKEQGVYI